MSQSFYLRSINSDLSVGSALFNRQLLENTATAASQEVSLTASQVVDAYAFTEPGIPGVDGDPGDYTVSVHVTSGATQINISTRLARVNSSGVVQAEGGFSTPDPGNAGVKVHEFTSFSLGDWEAGDRLRVQYRFENTDNMMVRALTIELNTVETELITPWVDGSEPQSEPVAAAVEAEVAGSVSSGVGPITSSVGTISESEVTQAISILTATTITVGAVTESDLAETVTPAAPSSNLSGIARVSLGPVSDPGVHDSHSAHVRAYRDGDEGTLLVWLYDNTTEIASWSQPLTTSPVTYILDLTEGEAAAITDYSDLELRFQYQGDGASPTEGRVTQAFLAVPATFAVQVVSVDPSSESEAVGTLSIALGLPAAVETEVGRIIGASQTGEPQSRPVDPAIETEITQAVSFRSAVTSEISFAGETEVAGVITVETLASIQVGAGIETEAGRAITFATSVTIPVTAAIEAEAGIQVAAVVGGAPQSQLVAAAPEVEAAEPISAQTQTRVFVTAAFETEEANFISLALSVSHALESEQARIVGAVQAGAPQSRPVDAAFESEAAQVVNGFSTQTVSVDPASELEVAQPIDAILQTSIPVAAASEVEEVTAFTVLAGAASIAVAFAAESDQANPVSVAAVFLAAVTAATETELAGTVDLFQGAASIPVVPALETELAQIVIVDDGIVGEIGGLRDPELGDRTPELGERTPLLTGRSVTPL